MSECSSDSSDDVFMRLYDMNDGLVALFQTFMMREEFAGALNFIRDCPQISPTSSVINEIIFKIMMTCDSDLSYEALTYLEGALRRMPTDDLHKDVFIEGLKDRTGSFPDLWDAFSHFVLSVLHDRKILEGFASSQEYVKSLNCDYLVEIYVKVFLKCSSNSPFFGYRPEENFTALMKWINVFYKHNVQMDEVLESLHLLLDHVIQCEISTRSAVPKCLAFQTAPLSQYILLIFSNCKDVFIHSKSLQRFFNNMESPLLILKICQRILDDLIGKESAHQNSVLTLKSIVEDYFFNQPKQSDPDPKQVSMSPFINRQLISVLR